MPQRSPYTEITKELPHCSSPHAPLHAYVQTGTRHFALKQTHSLLRHIHAAFIKVTWLHRSQAFSRRLFSPRPAGNQQRHNAPNRKGYKGDGLKIWGNGLAMTEALTITGSLHCLMPNGPLRVRLNGQLPTETRWTLCQFTIILAFVMQHSTNMPLCTDLWIIQLEQNAMTHFWSKSHHQWEEAFSRRCVFPSTEDKSFPPQLNL